jgi:hypothetical protein
MLEAQCGVESQQDVARRLGEKLRITESSGKRGNGVRHMTVWEMLIANVYPPEVGVEFRLLLKYYRSCNSTERFFPY